MIIQFFKSRTPHLIYLLSCGVIAYLTSLGDSTQLTPLKLFSFASLIVGVLVFYRLFFTSSKTIDIIEKPLNPKNFSNETTGSIEKILEIEEYLKFMRSQSWRNFTTSQTTLATLAVISLIVPLCSWLVAFTVYSEEVTYSNLWALIFSSTTIGWIALTVGKSVLSRLNASKLEYNYYTERLVNVRKMIVLMQCDESVTVEDLREYILTPEYSKLGVEDDKDGESKQLSTLALLAKIVAR